jgi:hypothetical protein
MPSAEEVAIFLAYEFLKRGNYSASAGPVEVPVLAQAVPAAVAEEEHEYFEGVDVFASLTVQSVGFEDGVDDPRVHIYLTRGSTRLMNSLPEEIDGVPLRAYRMGAKAHPVVPGSPICGTRGSGAAVVCGGRERALSG